ncbi:unnamed protein product [Heligmosomoides polygyrus]|uniref:7TM_GPCR_Srx domain-containing protein n=1 Tax=Heligmosomoides polygyrus TaxID=6339 RepID=A0A183GTX0_HELPZ|nr:unnamed protein product [Heligmosomoides polygyrus]
MCFGATYPGMELVVTVHRCGCVAISALIYVVVSLLLYKKFTKLIVKVNGRQLNLQQRKQVFHATITMG